MSKKVGWKFNLDGRSYSWCKADRQGDWGPRDHTTVEQLSWLLTQHFYPVRKFINKALKGKDNATFAVRAKLIFSGLKDVGEFFSLKNKNVKTKVKNKTVKSNKRLVWLAKTRKPLDGGHEWNQFIEWRILDCTSQDKTQGLSTKRIGQNLRDKNPDDDTAARRFQRLEKKSKALLRIAIVVYRNTWTIVPAKTRRDDD